MLGGASTSRSTRWPSPQGPGLAGALLVGIGCAKALAFALDKPLIAVNHLEGHIHAVLLEERQKSNREMVFVLALVVSGGHTHLYLAEQRDEHLSYQNIGHTRDDAAGEAFDKVGELLGLGYPGGPIIDRLSTHGNPTAVRFPPAQLKHRDRKDKSDATAGPRFDFSYSDIKTAVLRYVEVHEMRGSIEARRKALSTIEKPGLEDYLLHCDRKTLDLVASFQRALVSDLVVKTFGRGPGLQRRYAVRHRRGSRKQRTTPALRTGRCHGRTARVFPFTSTLDRQRCHDCGRSLS